MTREERLQRLRVELRAGNVGVFLIVSARTPIFGGTSLSLDRWLDSTDVGAQLRAASGNEPVEVLAAKGVSDDALRSLNHRRDQLRVGRPVLLVFDPSDCARVSRIADDLWKWATVVELDQPVKSWEHTAAHGVIAADRYAPALRPSDVVGPGEPLTASAEDSDP